MGLCGYLFVSGLMKLRPENLYLNKNYANARMCRLLSPRLPQWEACSCIWNHFNSTRNNNQAFNNLRNCVDCHSDFKFISYTVQRKIMEKELFIWLFLFSLIRLGATSLRLGLGVVQWWIHKYEILSYLG